MYTTKDKVLIIGDKLKVEGQIGREDLLIHYETYNSYRFLEFNGKSIVLDADLKKIAEITASSNSTLIGKTLYEVKGNSLVEIDLSTVVKD